MEYYREQEIQKSWQEWAAAAPQRNLEIQAAYKRSQLPTL